MTGTPKNSDILFVPLDIPLIPQKKDILENFFSSEREDYVWWNMDIILGARDLQSPLGSKRFDWPERVKDQYSSIVNMVREYLPFETLYYVHLSSAIKEVLPHVDENYVERRFPHHMTITPELKQHLQKNEPIGYRAIISGRRSSLYLCDGYDPAYEKINYTKKIYCQIPDETDFFLIQNSNIPHGVDKVGSDQNRIILFLLGEINEAKHTQLIENSCKRFPKHLILKDDLFGK